MAWANDTPSSGREGVKRVAIGACAWSYEDWRGVFYPEHLPAARRLEFYAKYLRAVEVDSTFYHAPKAQVTAHWNDVTPDAFRFACKLPREITHERRLRDSQELLLEFMQDLAPLGRKLACVLIQLPPSFSPKTDEHALREFVRELPGGARFAIEFRHPGWHQPRTADLLGSHGVCWVWNDATPLDHQQEGAFEFLPDTADFLYVRLMGDFERKYDAQGGHLHRYRELQWPRDAALESWAVRIAQNADSHAGVFVAATNHFEGFAPLTCQRLAARLGLHLSLPKPEAGAPKPPGEGDFLGKLFP